MNPFHLDDGAVEREKMSLPPLDQWFLELRKVEKYVKPLQVMLLQHTGCPAVRDNFDTPLISGMG